MLHESQIRFDGTFPEFEHLGTTIIRPYFDLMPVLHMKNS